MNLYHPQIFNDWNLILPFHRRKEQEENAEETPELTKSAFTGKVTVYILPILSAGYYTGRATLFVEINIWKCRK